MEQTSRQYFKSIKIIHFALFLGMVMFAAVVTFLLYTSSGSKVASSENTIFEILVPIILGGGFFASYYAFSYFLKQAKEKPSLIEKAQAYSTALIIRMALLEGAVLFSIVATLLTNNYLFLGLAAVVIAYFFTLQPNKDKFIAHLALNQDEKNLVMDDDAIISRMER